MIAFELAVQDLEGLMIARRVRADRVEVCSALSIGGLTPSIGLIDAAVQSGTPVHVLVRPRAGGFAFTSDEKALMLSDVRRALDAGAAGVVIGSVVDGQAGEPRIDCDFVASVVDAAGAASVTFHRAFDVVRDRLAALDDLVALGVRRVLTAGGAASAPDGAAGLAELARHACGRIEVMAGGGVTVDTAPAVMGTGVDAVHASAKRVIRGSELRLGSGEPSRETTDEDHARRLRRVIDAANAR